MWFGLGGGSERRREGLRRRRRSVELGCTAPMRSRVSRSHREREVNGRICCIVCRKTTLPPHANRPHSNRPPAAHSNNLSTSSLLSTLTLLPALGLSCTLCLAS